MSDIRIKPVQGPVIEPVRGTSNTNIELAPPATSAAATISQALDTISVAAGRVKVSTPGSVEQVLSSATTAEAEAFISAHSGIDAARVAKLLED